MVDLGYLQGERGFTKIQLEIFCFQVSSYKGSPSFPHILISGKHIITRKKRSNTIHIDKS